VQLVGYILIKLNYCTVKHENNQYFILLTVTYLTQQYKINSLLGFRGSKGYAKTPDLFRSVEISYPLLYRFRFSAKCLDFFSLMRCFDPIPNHGLSRWGFAITHFGHAQLGRFPPDEWSARGGDLYLTTHNIQKRHPWPRRDSNPQSQQASGRRYRTHHDVTLYIHFIAPLQCKIYSRRHYFCRSFYAETLNFLCVSRWTVGVLNTFWTIATDSGGHTEHLQQNSES